MRRRYIYVAAIALVLLISANQFFYLSRMTSKSTQGLKLNIYTTYTQEEAGGGPVYLKLVLNALDSKNIPYSLNDPDYRKYSVNLVFNYKCYYKEYTKFNFATHLLDENVDMRSFLFGVLAWDQIIWDGCEAETDLAISAKSKKDVVMRHLTEGKLIAEVGAQAKDLLDWKQDSFSPPIFTMPPSVKIPELTNRHKRVGAIIYEKLWGPDKPPITSRFVKLFEMMQIPFKIYRYYEYKNQDYEYDLERAQFMIAVVGFENFGHAMQTAKAYDVPILGHISLLRGMFSRECGVLTDFTKTSSSEQLAALFSDFQRNVTSNVFAPRKWAIDHLSPSKVDGNIVSILTKRRQTLYF